MISEKMNCDRGRSCGISVDSNLDRYFHCQKLKKLQVLELQEQGV